MLNPECTGEASSPSLPHKPNQAESLLTVIQPDYNYSSLWHNAAYRVDTPESHCHRISPYSLLLFLKHSLNISPAVKNSINVNNFVALIDFVVDNVVINRKGTHAYRMPRLP